MSRQCSASIRCQYESGHDGDHSFAAAAVRAGGNAADALRAIASLPNQSEDWHEADVAVVIAREALATLEPEQTP